MFKKVVVCAAAGVLLSGAALANAPTNETECQQLIDVTKQAFDARSLGPKTDAEVQSLMGALTEYCAAKQYEAADKMAELIRGLVAKE